MGRAPFDLRPGEEVAGYVIERAIGLGGSASVYRASHPTLAEPVALKIMHEHDPSGVGRPRFAREAALLQKLDHPHVVEMIDFGFTEEDLPYIVFELLQGRSLFTAIKRFGPFEPSRVGRIASQLLDALGAAHELGIIHRDIKPGNVYLCAGHDDDFAKLLDLGLAKALEGDGPETDTITGTGYRLGTPRYMSPEMARGQPVGAAGDLYAMGLIMGEMIAGAPMVKGNVQVDVLMAHGRAEPLPIDSAVDASPFGAVIRRAVAKELDSRYRTAAGMRADVDASLAAHRRAVASVWSQGVPKEGGGALGPRPPSTLGGEARPREQEADGTTVEIPPEPRRESVEEPPTTERLPRSAAPPSLQPAPPGPASGGVRETPAGSRASRRWLFAALLALLALTVLTVILGALGAR